MAKRLQLTKNVTPIGFDNEVTAEHFSAKDFIEKQKDFIIYKRSQNLSTMTLYDDNGLKNPISYTMIARLPSLLAVFLYFVHFKSVAH